jgi:apoptosis-inducing factor 2
MAQITAGSQLIGDVPASVAQAAANELRKLHVQVVYNTKVVDSRTVGGKYELNLSNGEKKTVDLYLPTNGVIPNTEFVPKEFLNEKGDIKMDEFLRVKNAPDVWAAGDVVDTEPSQLAFTGMLQLDLLAKGF